MTTQNDIVDSLCRALDQVQQIQEAINDYEGRPAADLDSLKSKILMISSAKISTRLKKAHFIRAVTSLYVQFAAIQQKKAATFKGTFNPKTSIVEDINKDTINGMEWRAVIAEDKFIRELGENNALHHYKPPIVCVLVSRESKEFIRLKHDFLCSRGGKSNRDHINNKIRNMVKTWVPDYMKAKDKKDKKNIVLETIDELNALKPPVRFFKKEQDSWIKVEEGQPVLEIVKAQFRHFEKSTWSEPAVKNDMVEVPVQDNNPVEVPVEDNVPVDGEWIIFGWPHDNREINFTELDRIETQ